MPIDNRHSDDNYRVEHRCGHGQVHDSRRQAGGGAGWLRPVVSRHGVLGLLRDRHIPGRVPIRLRVFPTGRPRRGAPNEGLASSPLLSHSCWPLRWLRVLPGDPGPGDGATDRIRDARGVSRRRARSRGLPGGNVEPRAYFVAGRRSLERTETGSEYSKKGLTMGTHRYGDRGRADRNPAAADAVLLGAALAAGAVLVGVVVAAGLLDGLLFGGGVPSLRHRSVGRIVVGVFTHAAKPYDHSAPARAHTDSSLCWRPRVGFPGTQALPGSW